MDEYPNPLKKKTLSQKLDYIIKNHDAAFGAFIYLMGILGLLLILLGLAPTS